MALKVLMLRKKLDLKKAELRELDKKFDELPEREAQIEQAISEAESDEERSVVEESIEAFEKDKTDLSEVRRSLEQAISKIEAEIEEIEKEEKADEPHEDKAAERGVKVKEKMTMVRSIDDMNTAERTEYFERENVKAFFSNIRAAITEKRSIKNGGVLIPEEMLPMIRRKISEYSKLINKVNKVVLSGSGRAVVEGDVSEGVWTEMCAKINELDLGFNDVEIDGFKVSGFLSVCNAQLEDSDYDLAVMLTGAIAKALGKALDKAIVYGSGTKMPLGIVTRLAQSGKPESYPATAREWENLSTTHVITGSAGIDGIKLFKEITKNTGIVANDYTDDGLIWIMNETTKATLVSEGLSVNAAGAIVSGIGNTMPVIGGEIITLSFIPDNNIVFGHGLGYLLGERKGIQIGTSEHYAFLDDKTVFKGTARYDGKPAIPEAFAVYGLNGTAPTTSGITFAADTANAAG